MRQARKAKLGEGLDNQAPSPGAEPTRTAKTVDAYRTRGDQLVKRFFREREIQPGMDNFNAHDFAVWLLALRVSLRPPSWRLYRQAALMVLGSMPDDRARQAMEMIEGDAPAEAEMGTGEPIEAADRVRLSSALKVKHLKHEDYVRLNAYLRMRLRSDTALTLQDWLRAGISTGLRPSEWKASEVVRYEDPHHPMGRRVYLLVLNAKATNGRANGVVRTLDISEFNEGAIASVQRMSDKGLQAHAAGRYREFQSNCAQTLYQACRKLWPRRKMHYALYSCRHQFIANHKALGLANEEISALAGHRVDDPAVHNDARSRAAWPLDKITEKARGVKEEIATVRRVLTLWEDRLRLMKIVKQGVRADDAGEGSDAMVPMADLY